MAPLGATQVVSAISLTSSQAQVATSNQTNHAQTPQGVGETQEVVIALRSADSRHFTHAEVTRIKANPVSSLPLPERGQDAQVPTHDIPENISQTLQGVSKTQEAIALSPYTTASQVASSMGFSPSDYNYLPVIGCGGKQSLATMLVGYHLVSTCEAPLFPSLSQITNTLLKTFTSWKRCLYLMS